MNWMLDVKTIIKDYLYDNWEASSPIGKDDISWTLGLEESNKTSTDSQVNIDEEVEPRGSRTFVVSGVYRVEQGVKITIFKKPTGYSSTTVAACETIINNIKTEIDRILNAGRYDITSINWVDLGDWENLTIREEEPIVYKTRQTIICIYYIVETLV